MFCGKCGAKCDDSETFCSSCGASLGEDAPVSVPEAPIFSAPDPLGGAPTATAAPAAKRSVNPKVVGLIAVCAAALVVVVLLFTLLGGGGGKGVYLPSDRNAIAFIYSHKEDSTLFFAGGKQLSGSVEDLNNSSSLYSTDKSVLVVSSSDSTLYVVNGKGVNKVADDVASYVLSASGKGIAYITDDGDLYVYSVDKGSKTKLDQDVEFDYYSPTLVISPDGKSVAYTASDDGDATLYLSRGAKEPVSVRKDAYPLGLNDGGTLYFTREDDLYLYKGKEDSKIAGDVENAVFNADLSEVLYYKDGKTYVSVGGKEPVKVTGASLYNFIAPLNGLSFNYMSSSAILGVHSFKGFCFESDNGAYRISDKLEANKFAPSGNNYILSQDGKKCLYLKNGDLYLVSNTAKDAEPKELTDGADISYFYPNADCSAVYYVDYDDALMYQKGAGKAVKIADDVENLIVSADGSTAYFLVDDALYTSAKGGKKAAVKGAGDVSNLWQWSAGVCYTVENNDDGFDYFYAASGAGFSPLYQDEG